MPAQERQKRILVVDDEPHIQNAVTLLAGWGGLVAQAVSTAEEALRHLEKKTFDLVITDNLMPDMSGIELAAAIKARWPSLPVVMFTAFPPALPAPCIDLVLVKPGDGLNLLKSVRRILQEKEGPS
jgi:CheY-like chemotaxis protein